MSLFRKILIALGLQLSLLIVRRWREFLRTEISRASAPVTFVDLYSDLERLSRPERLTLFLPQKHYGERGHQFIAERVYNSLGVDWGKQENRR